MTGKCSSRHAPFQTQCRISRVHCSVSFEVVSQRTSPCPTRGELSCDRSFTARRKREAHGNRGSKSAAVFRLFLTPPDLKQEKALRELVPRYYRDWSRLTELSWPPPAPARRLPRPDPRGDRHRRRRPTIPTGSLPSFLPGVRKAPKRERERAASFPRERARWEVGKADDASEGCFSDRQGQTLYCGCASFLGFSHSGLM